MNRQPLSSFLVNDDGVTCADSYVWKKVSLASWKKMFLDGALSWFQSGYEGKKLLLKSIIILNAAFW